MAGRIPHGELRLFLRAEPAGRADPGGCDSEYADPMRHLAGARLPVRCAGRSHSGGKTVLVSRWLPEHYIAVLLLHAALLAGAYADADLLVDRASDELADRIAVDRHYGCKLRVLFGR